jgi:hypothetical protein
MATLVQLKTAELELLKTQLTRMTDELDLLVAEGEDKVKDEKAAIESALDAKIEAIDEDIETRIIVIHAEAQRNIESMKAAAETKKRALTQKLEQKLESVKPVPKTGKMLALEKKIRSKEEVATRAQQFLEFCKTHDTCNPNNRPTTLAEILAAAHKKPRSDWSKMPNGEPYPFKDEVGIAQNEDVRRDPGCPYSPTELAYRAAAQEQEQES